MSDTVQLLKEVDNGCIMAINSMKRISDYGMSDGLAGVIDHYREEHLKLQKKAADLLRERGSGEKEPGMMASAMAEFTTKMKMIMREDNTQIAKIMMDGCNMGIQSIAEQIGKYSGASKESVGLAKDLIKTEEDFMRDLKQFL